MPVSQISRSRSTDVRTEPDSLTTIQAGWLQVMKGRRGGSRMRSAQDSKHWEINGSLVSPKFADGDLALMSDL